MCWKNIIQLLEQKKNQEKVQIKVHIISALFYCKVFFQLFKRESCSINLSCYHFPNSVYVLNLNCASLEYLDAGKA